MADISAITLPNGDVYNIKDAVARESIVAYGTFATNSASTTITTTSVATYNNGASVSLTAGTWIIIGQWTFSARASGTANTNLEVNLYDGSEMIGRHRVNVYGYAATVLQVAALYQASAAKTVYVRGGTGASISTACPNSITAVRIA